MITVDPSSFSSLTPVPLRFPSSLWHYYYFDLDTFLVGCPLALYGASPSRLSPPDASSTPLPAKCLLGRITPCWKTLRDRHWTFMVEILYLRLSKQPKGVCTELDAKQVSPCVDGAGAEWRLGGSSWFSTIRSLQGVISLLSKHL
jgi:hypothetical protein